MMCRLERWARSLRVVEETWLLCLLTDCRDMRGMESKEAFKGKYLAAVV
jgi:hypothetical protein